MSVKMISLVWEGFDGKPDDKLVMLAVADSAGADGVFSGDKKQIAHKCGLTPRQVGESLGRLASADWIVDEGNPFGDGQVFRILLKRLEGCQ